jgi:hypothetical protein
MQLKCVRYISTVGEGVTCVMCMTSVPCLVEAENTRYCTMGKCILFTNRDRGQQCKGHVELKNLSGNAASCVIATWIVGIE